MQSSEADVIGIVGMEQDGTTSGAGAAARARLTAIVNRLASIAVNEGGAISTITIRALAEATRARLRERAARNGRNVEDVDRVDGPTVIDPWHA